MSEARATPGSTRYLSRTYRAAAEREEELAVLLADLGSLGAEVRAPALEQIEIVGWFASPPDEHPGLPSRTEETRNGIRLVAEVWVGDEDWLAEYRRHATPRRIGSRFLVDPREPETADPVTEAEPGRIVLRLPAREAFGTGSHPSTRLVLAWLEDLPLRGARVLDVGCGSGILSLGAAALGARYVVGFDPDRVSGLLAGENRRRNPAAWPRTAAGGFFAGRVGAIAETDFDVALVNVLPHRVAADVPSIAARIARGGLALVSGLLAEEQTEVASTWAAQGLRAVEDRVEEEWMALRLERP